MTQKTVFILKIIVVLSILLTPFASNGQMEDIPSDLRWGSIQKAPKNSRLAKIIQANKNGLLALRYKEDGLFTPEQFWLEQYDAHFNLRAQHELALPENRKLDLQDIFFWHDNLYIITSRPQATDEMNRIWLRPISRNGQMIGSERLIAEIPQKDKFRKRQFALKFSKDSSFLLLYNQLPPVKDGPEQFTLRVFDQDFNLHWSKDVSLPFRDQNFSIRDYQIDDSGNVFILGRRIKTQNNRRIPDIFTLFAYTNTGKTEMAYHFEIDKTVIHHLSFSVAPDGQLVFGGIYSLVGDTHNFGLCHVNIDIENQLIDTLRLSPFLEESIENGRLKNDNPKDYRLRDLVLRSDGGLVIIAEQYARSKQQAMTQYEVQNETYFIYNDILVANMTADGNFSWIKRIPKLQVSINDGGVFSSFTQATVRDRFYFIYNDNPENFSPENVQQKNVNQYTSVVSLSEIRRDGTLNTVPLFVNKDADIITRPKLCQQIGARSILVYGEDGRDYRFGLLRLE